MAATIDGLLVLSQIGKSKLSRQRVDLTALTHRVVEDLNRRQPRRVTVDIAEGLEAFGDPRLVEVAIEHLIGNAWKFSSRTHDARIEVGQHVFAGEKVFFVKDNGAGFDMVHTGRLFTPFVRLHGAEFEGNGIGLATVKRIMDRHEGRVWAEAQRDRGATLSFTFGA
jgi:light-regulated signal transduction histidine kinase (bacteriophytochrome)